MQSFKDKTGTTWDLDITVAAMKRVRDLAGVNLYQLAADGAQLLAELLSDPVKLVDVLYVLCKAQCETRNLTDEAFGRAFDGPAFEAAAEAFVLAATDFFPEPQRTALRNLVTKTRSLQAEMVGRAEKELAGLTLDSLLARLKPSSGSAPAGSDSTPAP